MLVVMFFCFFTFEAFTKLFLYILPLFFLDLYHQKYLNWLFNMLSKYSFSFAFIVLLSVWNTWVTYFILRLHGQDHLVPRHFCFLPVDVPKCHNGDWMNRLLHILILPEVDYVDTQTSICIYTKHLISKTLTLIKSWNFFNISWEAFH